MIAATSNSVALVDTNILVYAYDLGEPSKHTVARELIQSLSDDGRLLFSTQVLNTERGIKATLDILATAARGSRLVFTYVRKDFLSGQNMHGQERLYRRYIVDEKIRRFGMNPQEVSDLLAPCGWRVIEYLDYPQLAVR